MTRKHTTIFVVVALNVVIWLYVILAPFLYHHGNHPMNEEHYLRDLVFPLTDCLLCYLNFYIFAPRYLDHRRFYRFVITNVVVISVLVLVRELFFPMLFPLPPEVTMRPEPEHMPPTWMLYVRSSFSLAFVSIATTAIRFSLQWMQSEEEQHKAELQLKAVELKMLRNQINPHFLLNTLNNIYALINFNPQHAADAVTRLAALLRYLLYEVPEQGVEVQRMASLCEDYISLMHLRMNKNVDVSFDSEVPDGHGPFVATFLIMPILENAFKHGVSATKKSYIHVILRCDDNIFYFCCRNSNFPQENVKYQPGGIGLEQVQKRLELAYPGHYTYSAGPSPDGKEYSTEIEIHFPKSPAEEDEKARSGQEA
ncbi:MAG: histidine kinase [Alloprevotella sp.]|nr:histidine kinase [Alloprevotella sp.]